MTLSTTKKYAPKANTALEDKDQRAGF